MGAERLESHLVLWSAVESLVMRSRRYQLKVYTSNSNLQQWKARRRWVEEEDISAQSLWHLNRLPGSTSLDSARPLKDFVKQRPFSIVCETRLWQPHSVDRWIGQDKSPSRSSRPESLLRFQKVYPCLIGMNVYCALFRSCYMSRYLGSAWIALLRVVYYIISIRLCGNSLSFGRQHRYDDNNTTPMTISSYRCYVNCSLNFDETDASASGAAWSVTGAYVCVSYDSYISCMVYRRLFKVGGTAEFIQLSPCAFQDFKITSTARNTVIRTGHTESLHRHSTIIVKGVVWSVHIP